MYRIGIKKLHIFIKRAHTTAHARYRIDSKNLIPNLPHSCRWRQCSPNFPSPLAHSEYIYPHPNPRFPKSHQIPSPGRRFPAPGMMDVEDDSSSHASASSTPTVPGRRLPRACAPEREAPAGSARCGNHRCMCASGSPLTRHRRWSRVHDFHYYRNGF